MRYGARSPGIWAANGPTDWICPLLLQTPGVLAQDIHWEAHLDRLIIGREPVPAYRLETRVLDHPIVIYVSTLGEILRVELPGGVTAAFDQFGNP